MRGISWYALTCTCRNFSKESQGKLQSKLKTQERSSELCGYISDVQAATQTKTSSIEAFRSLSTPSQKSIEERSLSPANSTLPEQFDQSRPIPAIVSITPTHISSPGLQWARAVFQIEPLRRQIRRAHYSLPRRLNATTGIIS